jgi:hypothetical protein
VITYPPYFPTHPALTVLAWEDERTDVHAVACRTHCDGVSYLCACGFETKRRATDLDASADLISHALDYARFTVVKTRTDCDYRAVDGENLTREMALSLIACNRELAQSKHLRGRDGALVPYLSVARWSIVPQQAQS